MNVIRSPPCTRNPIPGISPLDGTPNKRLRPASNDDCVFEDQMCSKIESLISESIKKEMGTIVEKLKTSVKETVENCIQKSIQDGLQALEIDLSECRKHHMDMAALKQHENQMRDKIKVLEEKKQTIIRQIT